MKVIHILNEIKFSGAEIMYVDAAPLFQQKGCELFVVATAVKMGEYAPYFDRAGYTVLHKPIPPLKNYLKRLNYYWQFSRFLKNEHIDIVHIHSHGCMWGLSFSAWLAKKRSVYTFHNVFRSPKITYLYHYMRRWSVKNIFKCKFQTISDSVYENELNYFHNPTTKIYNWYGSNRFFSALDDEKEKIRADLKITKETVVLISIGGCSSIKRHTEIIRALSLIIDKAPDLLYLHLGEGDCEEEEKQLAHKLGLDDYVRFIGNQSDVRKYLIASDIYLMTSCFEGIPLAAIEAMGCRIPAILYDVPGLRDFNKTGENSILIPENFRVLAEKILFLKENPLCAVKIIQNAEIMVNDKYSMEKNVALIYNMYK